MERQIRKISKEEAGKKKKKKKRAGRRSQEKEKVGPSGQRRPKLEFENGHRPGKGRVGVGSEKGAKLFAGWEGARGKTFLRASTPGGKKGTNQFGKRRNEKCQEGNYCG